METELETRRQSVQELKSLIQNTEQDQTSIKKTSSLSSGGPRPRVRDEDLVEQRVWSRPTNQRGASCWRIKHSAHCTILVYFLLEWVSPSDPGRVKPTPHEGEASVWEGMNEEWMARVKRSKMDEKQDEWEARVKRRGKWNEKQERWEAREMRSKRDEKLKKEQSKEKQEGREEARAMRSKRDEKLKREE